MLGLVGGGTIGTVVTAVLTTSHEREEKRRDRMLAAAELFLGALEELQQSLWEYRVAVGEVRRTRQRAEEAAQNVANSADPAAEGRQDAEAKGKQFADAVERVTEVVLPVRQNIQRAKATIPRLIVLFAGKDGSAAVVEAAKEAFQTCLDRFHAIDVAGSAADEDFDQANDHVSELAQSTNQALEDFAVRVSDEIRA